MMTGGLLIWALHFVGVYLISSAADVWSSSEAGSARWTGLAFSIGCVIAVIAQAVWLGRGRREGSESGTSYGHAGPFQRQNIS